MESPYFEAIWEEVTPQSKEISYSIFWDLGRRLCLRLWRQSSEFSTVSGKIIPGCIMRAEDMIF